jgi:hypothetical protein
MEYTYGVSSKYMLFLALGSKRHRASEQHMQALYM